MDHIIPPMNHPLGRHWRQPRRENILIDDTHAVISEHDWEQLSKYDSSTPSGVYPGKMWSRDETYGGMRDGGIYLCWYGIVSDTPSVCSVNYRQALIIKR